MAQHSRRNALPRTFAAKRIAFSEIRRTTPVYIWLWILVYLDLYLYPVALTSLNTHRAPNHYQTSGVLRDGRLPPNCTLPTDSGIVGGPNVRSTAVIVAKSVSLIGLATWSVLRLNVAPTIDGRSWTRNTLARMGTKLVWMIIMLAAPDIPISRAAANLLSATSNNPLLQEWAKKDRVEWPLTYTILANMGGIAISLPKDHGELAKMAEAHPGLLRMLGTVWILDARQLLLARQSGVIKSLPDIKAAEIDDKNKSNGFIHLLAIAQCIFAAGQLFARWYKGILSTPLELATVAYATCALMLYSIEWYKPLDLNVPFTMESRHDERDIKVLQSIAAAAPRSLLGTQRELRSPYITNGSIHKSDTGFAHVYTAMNCTLVSSTALFGCIHLFAWNYHFPTNTEQLLWKIAAVSGIVTPLLWVLVVKVEAALDKKSRARKFIYYGRWITLATVYLLARLFIFVEVFRSLFYLHPSVFIATFTGTWSWIP